MNNIRLLLHDNKALIFDTLAVGGVILTVIFAHKDTIKAEEKKATTPISSKKKDRVVELAPCYIRTAICTTATIGCILAARKTHLADKAVLGTLGAAWGQRAIAAEHTLNDIQNNIQDCEEQYVPVQTQTVKDRINTYTDNYVKEHVVLEDIYTDHDIIEVYESYSNQVIFVTKSRWYMALSRANILLQKNDAIGINLIILLLGGKPDPKLNNIGWSLDDEVCQYNWGFTGGPCIEFEPIPVTMENGKVRTLLYFTAPPQLLDTVNDIVNDDEGWQ